MTPERSEFERLFSNNDIVPVMREIPVDMDTPVSLFNKVANGDYCFLLESLEGGERWGRYSFIGLDPWNVVKVRGTKITRLGQQGEEEVLEVEDPISYIADLFKGVKMANVPGTPRFSGGAVGYLGYDMVRFIERLPDHLEDTAGFNDAVLMFPKVVLCLDNLKQTLKIIYNVDTREENDWEAAYDKAQSRIEDIIGQVRRGIDYPGEAKGAAETNLEPEVSRTAFKEAVAKAKEYIRAGDIIQVVLSQRFSGSTKIPPFELYRAIRRINPSPYLYYLKMADEVLIGSSPEILVRLTDDLIELRPIAGTRPRGHTEEEDKALERELLADPKEKAEHVMLVDLGRNDVGKVAEMGSVKVTDFMIIERYSHVMHIVSNVVGRLKKGLDMFDVFRACFPAGTVSGAPKIRAMEIIEELEHARRGPYAGAVGYFDYAGNMDLAIAIRTLCQKGDKLYLQAGAGIVADSDPEKEWQETINKGKALMKAIEYVKDGS
ncbi:MAG: anthranilate synthase component I [Thermodesulfobacteria bacterium]|nr:anthranilate synthase component I [Thermodesulfobacteriota bacterium]